MAVPAVDPKNPQPGTLVRLTFYPFATYRHYNRFVEHRELEVESVGEDSEHRLFVATVCNGAKSTIFADGAGRFPQFKLAADPAESLDWRTGYYDALEFIPADRRYLKPSETYAAGYALGIQDRKRLGLRQCNESVVLETHKPLATPRSSEPNHMYDIGRRRRRR